MRPFRALILLASGLLALPALALTPIPDTRPPPRIWIAPAADLQPVRLQSVSIHIDSLGPLARTRIELVFHNPNARVLEGEFVFPLGAGQTVSGYALEVEGEMREGVVVPKQTARVAFEDTIRQQIDPGLAELTQGNVFRTRLYPIPAQGNKRVALSFEQLMPLQQGSYRYLLPLSFDAPVDRFEVRAVAQSDGATSAPASPDPALRFDRAGPGWSAGFVRSGLQPQRELAFEIPAGDDASAQVEAQDTLQPAWRSVIAQIDAAAPRTGATVKAKRVAVFFDASASASTRDLARERRLLQAWLTAAEVETLWLVPFRDAAEPARRFDLQSGDSSALMDALQALPLDGGSRYGSIDLATLPAVDRVLVIGDGLHNFGDASSALRSADGAQPRVSVLLAAQRADHARLQRLARDQGGEVVDLLQLDEAQALAALLAPERRLLAAQVSEGRCEDLLPAVGEAVSASFLLSARCEGKARITLDIGNAEASERLSIEVGSRQAASADLADSVHRLRAQQQILRLGAQDTVDTVAITELAVRHAVVTPWTSLLVLDRIEDYVRYRIAPKEPELRAQYEALLAAQPKPRPDVSQRNRQDRLLADWAEFSRWHRQAHPWLETLLPQAAATEAELWRSRAAGDRSARRGLREAERLEKHSRALQARWSTEGAESASRARWEREAAEQLAQLLDLRARREALPDLPSRQSGSSASSETVGAIALAAPPPSAPPPPSPSPAPSAAPVEQSLDQIQVTGALVGDSAAEAEDEGASDEDSTRSRAEIQLSAWNPDTPYLKALRAADDAYAEYLRQREDYRETPSFYLDAADFFRAEAKDAALAQRVLSNLAEISTENTALTRVLAYRLAQWDLARAGRAASSRTALLQRPEEPQSYRDLALALARLPEPDRSRHRAAVDGGQGDWHGRFPEHRADRRCTSSTTCWPAPIRPDPRAWRRWASRAACSEPVDTGLRVVLTWDADNTDIDLWVIDPVGEETYYGRNRSRERRPRQPRLHPGLWPGGLHPRACRCPGTYRVRATTSATAGRA
jgi:Ca-activated chloride channel homolog